MLSNKVKIFLAFTVTASGWAGTTYWYQNATQKIFEGESVGAQLAVLQTANNGVERKPGNRLIWQPSKSGTLFVDGDTIRTTENGEGLVKLLDSGTVINLEPESLIVLKKTKESISLDLLSGGLFIKSKAKKSNGNSPTIRAGKTVFSLGEKDSEMNLNIGKDNKTNVAVSKGNVDINTNGKTSSLEEGKVGELNGGEIKEIKLIETISPAPNSISDLGPKGDKQTTFQWKPLDKDFDVILNIGKSRSRLQAVESTKKSGDVGKITVKLKPGKIFWQLTAKSKKDPSKTTRSSIQRLEAIALSPAVLVSPAVTDEFFLVKEKVKIDFSWSVGDFADRSYLLVSTDPAFKNIFKKKNMKNLSDYSVPFKKHGTYFWKVVSFVNGRKKPLFSKAQSLIIHERLNIKPPLLVFPKNKTSIPLSKAKASSIFLEWSEIPGIEKYELSIVPKKGEKQVLTLDSNQYRLKKIAAGTFSWKVKSLGPAEQSSKWSKTFKYKIVKARKISWLSPEGELFRYNTKLPSVSLSWKKGSKSAKKWRVRYASLTDSLVDKEWKTISNPKIKIPLPQDGKFLFEVQGINKSGEVVAIGKKKTIEVLPPPTLAAPSFVDFDEKSKETSKDGSIKIKWEKVEGSANYVVKITNRKTKKIETYNKKKTSLQLRNMDPGKYEVLIGTVNERKEMGDFGESKIIEVPATSDIEAPSIDGIRVH